MTASVSKLTSAHSNFMSYDAAVVSSAKPAGLPTTGSVVVRVAGNGMGSSGYSIKKFTGFSNCASSTWTSTSQIACQASSGISFGYAVVISVIKQVSGSLTRSISYNAIPTFSPVLNFKNSPCTGAAVLVASGSSFGDKGHSLALRIADFAAESSRWISESSTNVKFAQGGFNAYQSVLPFVASVGRQVRGDANIYVSYDFASVYSLTRMYRI